MGIQPLNLEVTAFATPFANICISSLWMLHITYANPAFPLSLELFPTPPPPPSRSRRAFPTLSGRPRGSAFSCLNASTAAVLPAWLQDSGAMFLLAVLLTGIGGLHAGPVSVVYSYDKDDTQRSKPLLAQMDCNYHGYVAGFPNSLVSLNTCSGLRGTLQIKNISYGIEPVEAISGFVHMIYKEKNDNANIRLLGEDETYSRNSEFQVREGSKSFPRYLEMYIVVDKNLMLTQLKTTVVISSIEIWSNKNKISTTGTPNNILSRFLNWKSTHLFQPYHTAYLFAYKKQPSFIGATFPRKICDKNYAAGVVLYPDAITLEGFSVIIAQLLGLKIGLTYNDNNKCSCLRATCIMNPEAVGSSGIKIFSNCSMHDYRYFVSKSEAKCLQNFSNLQPLYQNQSVCGNGILEPNEECDCGSEEECQFKKCCDYSTCKLKGSVKCGSGPCCTSKCEISVAGTPCRKSIDQECDFTEYCNGTSSNCVPDTYALNGQLCRFGTAYCYNGQCQTTDNQCAQIFGKGAQGAPFACFEEINSLRDRFGNSGFKNSQPLPCEQKDVLCGKLACVWPDKNTYKSAVQSAVYSYIPGHVCISVATGSSVRSDGRDYVYVADGTVCGAQMYCVNKTCKGVHLMGYNCNATTKCKGNGICNNLGNCHCFPGYKPPDCEFQIDSPGGSIDDGNVQKSGDFFIKKGYDTHRNNWLVLSFYIVLPFFTIFTIMIMKRNEMRKSRNRENTEYEG
ncbi:disintegrin and metalloproteinase domain-containing protein 18-like [Equus quagga]|uniref:disintegrin and metalloproteinase domain-containing protein 18-like n=1 Tax=Equus quagga TaxID=89248 RepID=UPI001EE399BB|nr:disintegrin and metalloproteinase domain-containing protein 18-like [Equus quagga]